MSDPGPAYPKPTPTLPAERRRVAQVSKRPTARDRALADRLCARLVKERAGYKCEAKGDAGIECSHTLDWAHGFTRKKSSRNVRWSHLGTFCLCREHHRYYGARVVEWRLWMLLRLGTEDFERLRVLANSNVKVDMAWLLAELRAGRTQAERT